MRWGLQSDPPPLREFVYVDEVSVYSLISSRVGALPTEFTETQTSATKFSNTTSLGVERMPLRGSFGSTQEDSQSSSSQVIKKSTIQTTFREFHWYEQPRMVLLPSESVLKSKGRPRLVEVSDLGKAARGQLSSTWVVSTEEFERGRLFEVDVSLSTNNLFKFSTIFSTLSDIIMETPELFPGVLDAQFKTATAVNRVLNRLLVGLIPIEARVVDYFVARIGPEEAYVVHRSVLNEPALRRVSITPLTVAGVTEQGLYWRDIRRILFAERTFRVLGRIAEAGLVETWRPVKLAEVLAEAVPTLTHDLNESANLGLASFGTNPSRNEEVDEQHQVEESLRIYGKLLKQELALADDDALAPSLPRPVGGYGSMADVTNRREVFSLVTDWYRANYDMDQVSPDRIAAMRSEALKRAGFDERGKLIPPTGVSESHDSRQSEAPLLLESEIVAIYW